MSRQKLRFQRKKCKSQGHDEGGFNEHHLYPTSRGKKGDLGKFKDILVSLKLLERLDKHDSWHHLFDNLFAEEVIINIKRAVQAGKHTTHEIISFIKQRSQPHRAELSVSEKDLKAWQKIFNGHTNLRQIRKIIRRDWMYPGIYVTVSGSGRVVGVTIFLPKVVKIGFRGIRVASYKDGQLLKLT